jgi:hypothetical protein
MQVSNPPSPPPPHRRLQSVECIREEAGGELLGVDHKELHLLEACEIETEMT